MQAVSIVKPIREALAVTLWTFICLNIFVFKIEIALAEFSAPHRLFGFVVLIVFDGIFFH